jgi:hypothetical protein
MDAKVDPNPYTSDDSKFEPELPSVIYSSGL